MLDKPAGVARETPPPRGGAGDGGASPAAAWRRDGLDAGQLLSALRRRRMVLVACATVIPLLAVLALNRIAPLYTAIGTVLYDDRTYAAQELQSILRADPTTDAIMSSQAEIVRSLSTAERVADRLQLDRNPDFNAALRPPGFPARVMTAARSWMGLSERQSSQADTAAARRGVLLAVQSAFTVATVKASRVLEVSFTAHDPDLAAAAVNLAMQLYIQDQLDAKVDAVQRATAWLEKRVAELRDAVNQSEDRIAAYRARHGLSQGVRAGLDAERLSRLNEDLLSNRNELVAAQGRLDAARGHAGAAAQASIAPSVVQARSLRDQLAGQLQALLARAGPGHPSVPALRSQLADAERVVAAETARVVAAAEAELRADRDRVGMLEAALREAQTEQDHNGEAQVALNAMQRDVDAERTLLQSVQERLQQTAQQTAIETPDARIISRALPPGEPSYPRRGPLIAAACAFGILSGLLLVYVLELADGTFRGGEDVRARLGLRCFALIPETRRGELRRVRLHDYVLDHPLTPYAEQVRALRAGLWLGRSRPRIVAITAARPSEGKTTVALALARSAAQAGERVVLLDCDVRQPSIGRTLGMDGADGLIDCLQGRVPLETVLQRDERSGLAVIPAGSLEVNALSLFMSEAMAALLQRLRQDYDLVLLDAPPAHALTDARVIAGMAEATLLCLRWRSTPFGVVRHALDLLEEAQASVVGVTLTRVDMRAHVRSGFADAEVYHPRYGGYFRA
jgi:capsular exopolysaccharide synthesis family protein